MHLYLGLLLQLCTQACAELSFSNTNTNTRVAHMHQKRCATPPSPAKMDEASSTSIQASSAPGLSAAHLDVANVYPAYGPPQCTGRSGS
ncbi:hypothetical protein KC19_3G270800 [Ceratodon purpureus]|uniref:Secreted protein n=1 Tax=Ceratodon purpureus TaxID=3225 RepID=A0A8T0IQE7_CERPU|nr:hypothetical protein KC19_3G270800 [Ceratodon purpureus]